MQGEEGGERAGGGGHLGQAHNKAQEKVEIFKKYIEKCCCQHTDNRNPKTRHASMASYDQNRF
jgi:hypothetical protein